MPAKKVLIFSIAIFLLAFGVVLMANQKVFATHQCKKITDLDDRAECYAKEIEEKREEYESTSQKLHDISTQINEINSALAGYLNELSVTQAQIDELQAQINEIKAEVEKIKELLTDRRGQLAKKINLRNLAVRNYLKRNFRGDLELFFSFNGFQYSTLTYIYNKSVSGDSLKLIKLLNSEIDTYEDDKKEAEDLRAELETTQGELLSLKSDMDSKKLAAQTESNVLAEEQADTEQELEDIERVIADLSSKQQEILNAKYGTESGSVGDYEPPEAPTPDPPFSPAFAAFSYGAYTHYKGMSQYGAKGRADDDQSYEDIIEFYYKAGVKEKNDFPDEICVEGYGNMDFQEYLYGLAEMPSSWDKEALRAQAVAGRSYAHNRTKNGGCICTTQSCQVFSKSKSDNPPGRWKEAVDDTKDEIIGGDMGASGYGWYSSTTGGYIENVGWDQTSGWPNGAWEKIAGSPWFRKAWYTKSYNDSSTCGRAHPWLTAEELADIVNAYIVYTKGSKGEADHITPVTTSCWSGDPYSLDEMREKSEKYGGGHKEAKSIKASTIAGGKTTSVEVTTNKGVVSMNGEKFKTVYNLRAPSYVSIRSRLFDFEKE